MLGDNFDFIPTGVMPYSFLMKEAEKRLDPNWRLPMPGTVANEASQLSDMS